MRFSLFSRLVQVPSDSNNISDNLQSAKVGGEGPERASGGRPKGTPGGALGRRPEQAPERALGRLSGWVERPRD